MGKEKNYIELYKLQDKVLRIVNELENDFYLTGGTALHRFHYDFRYSEDLDFFMIRSRSYREDIAEILEKMEEEGLSPKVEVEARDFHRIYVDGLQIDFVNDSVYRYGKSVYMDDIRVDNLTNIFTNKIGAIFSRDENKDMFDFWSIVKKETFDWGKILEIVNKKENFNKSDFIFRLQSYPLEEIHQVDLTGNCFLEVSEEDVEKVCEDIQKERENTIANLPLGKNRINKKSKTIKP